MGMYGLGFGLGKMMEGASGGAVQGSMDRMVWQREDERTRKEDEYKEKQIQRLEDQADIDKMRMSAEALKSAYSIAEKSPDPDNVFKQVYSRMNPTGEIPQVTFSGPTMDINYQGFKMKGSRQQMLQAMDLISKHPERSPEIIGQLAQLGLASVEIPEPKEDKRFNVGRSLVDASGNVIYRDPEPDPRTRPESVYTQQQLVDDTKQYYDFLRASLMDPEFKTVIAGKEKDYANLVNQYQQDLQLIAQGKQPSWRTVPQAAAPAPVPGPAAAPPSMNEMPDPKQSAGKIIRDTESGKRYRSDGTQWLEIK